MKIRLIRNKNIGSYWNAAIKLLQNCLIISEHKSAAKGWYANVFVHWLCKYTPGPLLGSAAVGYGAIFPVEVINDGGVYRAIIVNYAWPRASALLCELNDSWIDRYAEYRIPFDATVSGETALYIRDGVRIVTIYGQPVDNLTIPRQYRDTDRIYISICRGGGIAIVGCRKDKSGIIISPLVAIDGRWNIAATTEIDVAVQSSTLVYYADNQIAVSHDDHSDIYTMEDGKITSHWRTPVGDLTDYLCGYFIAAKKYEIMAVRGQTAAVIHRFDEQIGSISTCGSRMAVKTSRGIYVLETSREEIEDAIVCGTLMQI